MNSKIMSFIFISVVLIFLSVSATEKQNPQWKGSIEEEEGVKVIKNPNEPLYGEIEFELEEDLSIGSEEDENYMFYKGVNFNVDSEGNILVLNFANYQIQKYDKDGKYVQSFGSKGQGPGEFEQPQTILFDSQQNIYVQDARDIDIFDKNGKHIKSTVLSVMFVLSIGITKEGNIIGHSQAFGPKMIEEVVLIDEEGKKIKTIVTYKSDVSFGKGMDLGSIYSPGLCFYPINEQLAVYGYSSEYKLFVIDSSGNIAHIIEKDEPPTTLSQKEINKLLDDFAERMKKRNTGPKYSRNELKKSSKFPKNVVFFRAFIADNKGRIYVNKFKSRLDEYEGGYYDIFSKEGYYLYRTKISPYPQIIRNGLMYTADYNQETGYFKIKRYKIKNWGQLKEGL
jgi:hypothetical protein